MHRIFFSGEKKKSCLSGDRHFTWLLKNDINVAGCDDGVAVLAAKALENSRALNILEISILHLLIIKRKRLLPLAY